MYSDYVSVSDPFACPDRAVLIGVAPGLTSDPFLGEFKARKPLRPIEWGRHDSLIKCPASLCLAGRFLMLNAALITEERSLSVGPAHEMDSRPGRGPMRT